MKSPFKGDYESDPDWTDATGRSPLDLMRAYLARRYSWDKAALRLELRGLAPDRDEWQALLAKFAAIHAELSTPRLLSVRDRSYGSPTFRDPDKTRLIAVERTPIGFTLVTEEDDPGGYLEPFRFDLYVIRSDGLWRLDDRVEVSATDRILGLL